MNADKGRNLAQGRWVEILATLAPTIIPAIECVGHHVPCPVHGGKDGFRTFNDVNHSGGTICNTCGSYPDGFSTLMWINGWDFKTALQAVVNFLEVGSTKIEPIKREIQVAKKVSEEKLRQALNRTWREAFPLTDIRAEVGRVYLARRGISLLPEGRVIRFHPSLPYFEKKEWIDNYPAILSLVSDASGKPVTIHRTYLTDAGIKASVSSPKKLMRYPGDKVLTGGAIRLAKLDSPVLAVAEGLETALSVMEGIRLPVWCVINANLLEKFTPPAAVRKVLIFADKDAPSKQHPSGHGQEAARNLVQRLWKMNIRVSLAIPHGDILPGEKSLDWNDILLRRGKTWLELDNIQPVMAL